MNVTDLFAKRFEDLETELSKLIENTAPKASQVAIEPWHQWTTSVLDILAKVPGGAPQHLERFSQVVKQSVWGTPSMLTAAGGVFRAARRDYLGGYLVSVETLLTGEVFGDLVGLAKTVLADGHFTVAAVLASAALEDALKRYASIQGLDVDDKVMQEVISALKSKGLLQGAQKTLIDVMPKLRDWAMHANWDKFTAVDVSGLIGFVDQFLLTHFSPPAS